MSLAVTPRCRRQPSVGCNVVGASDKTMPAWPAQAKPPAPSAWVLTKRPPGRDRVARHTALWGRCILRQTQLLV